MGKSRVSSHSHSEPFPTAQLRVLKLQPTMRTIMPFASSPLHLQMSPTQTTEAREHMPTALNPQELSRSASPQQSNLSLLVSIPICTCLSFAPDRVPGLQWPCCSPLTPRGGYTLSYTLQSPVSVDFGAVCFHPVYPLQSPSLYSAPQRSALSLERSERVFTRPWPCHSWSFVEHRCSAGQFPCKCPRYHT